MRVRTVEAPVPDAPHWGGDHNKPAKVASRSFDPRNPNFSPDDANFLYIFNSSFPCRRPNRGNCCLYPQSTIQADPDAARTAIESATVDAPARLRDWRLWTNYCASNGYPDLYLADDTPGLQVYVLVTFAARYCTGVLGKGHQVKAGLVTTALRHVGQMYELTGLPDPRRPHGGKDLSLIFAPRPANTVTPSSSDNATPLFGKGPLTAGWYASTRLRHSLTSSSRKRVRKNQKVS
jgi:hypothetical protein